MSKGRELSVVIGELMKQSEAKADYIAPAMGMRMQEDGSTFEINHLSNRECLTFDSSKVLHRQIGSVLNIPARYYDLMQKEKPELLARNVNAWFADLDGNYMVRSFQYPGESIGRALLSAQYRRIDNLMIAETVLPLFAGSDQYAVISSEVTERKLYFKIVNKRLEADVSVGDTVQAGVIVSNSEVGMGAVNIQPFIYRLVCSNGMVVTEMGNRMRKTHVGRLQEAVENSFMIYTSETQEAEDKALALQIRDHAKAAIDEAMFKGVVNTLRSATEVYINGNPGEVIKLAGKVYDFTSTEQTGILRHLVEGGDLSKYGLSNAVTRTSQDVEDYDRATELEEIGWKVATMENGLWEHINGNAYVV